MKIVNGKPSDSICSSYIVCLYKIFQRFVDFCMSFFLSFTDYLAIHHSQVFIKVMYECL